MKKMFVGNLSFLTLNVVPTEESVEAFSTLASVGKQPLWRVKPAQIVRNP